MTAWNMAIFIVHRQCIYTYILVICACVSVQSRKKWKQNVAGEGGKTYLSSYEMLPHEFPSLEAFKCGYSHTHLRSQTSTHLSISSWTSFSLSHALSINLSRPLTLSLSWHNNFSLNSLTDAGFRLRAKVPNSFRSKLTLCDVLLDNWLNQHWWMLSQSIGRCKRFPITVAPHLNYLNCSLNCQIVPRCSRFEFNEYGMKYGI